MARSQRGRCQGEGGRPATNLVVFPGSRVTSTALEGLPSWRSSAVTLGRTPLLLWLLAANPR